MSSTKRKVVPHKHLDKEVYAPSRTKNPKRPYQRGLHESDVTVDTTISLEDRLDEPVYNYVANPSFEYDDWGGDEAQSTNVAKFGKFSAKLQGSTGSENLGKSNYVDVRGETKITLSAWFYCASLNGEIQFKISCYNSSKALLETHTWESETETPSEWTQYTHTYTIADDFHANTAYVRVWATLASITSLTLAFIDGYQLNFGVQELPFQDQTSLITPNEVPAVTLNAGDETIASENIYSITPTVNSGVWTTLQTLTPDEDTETYYIVVSVALSAASSVGVEFVADGRVKIGSIYYPINDSGSDNERVWFGKLDSGSGDYTGMFMFVIPLVSNGDSVEVQIRQSTGTNFTSGCRITAWGITPHTHDIDQTEHEHWEYSG